MLSEELLDADVIALLKDTFHLPQDIIDLISIYTFLNTENVDLDEYIFSFKINVTHGIYDANWIYYHYRRRLFDHEYFYEYEEMATLFRKKKYHAIRHLLKWNLSAAQLDACRVMTTKHFELPKLEDFIPIDAVFELVHPCNLPEGEYVYKIKPEVSMTITCGTEQYLTILAGETMLVYTWGKPISMYPFDYTLTRPFRVNIWTLVSPLKLRTAKIVVNRQSWTLTNYLG